MDVQKGRGPPAMVPEAETMAEGAAAGSWARLGPGVAWAAGSP